MTKYLKAILLVALLFSSGYLISAEIDDLNIVDASNTARFPEGMTAGQVNDSARALEGLIARWHEDTGARKSSTGSANAYVFAAAQTLTAYYDGLVIGFDANFANTAAATLAVDGLAATTIKKNFDQDLAANDIKTGQKVVVVYDGTNFQVLSPLGNVGLANIVEDTTPQLGGHLDVNGQVLGDGTLEVLRFTTVGNAVNDITIRNNTVGNSPRIQASGDDANISLYIESKGTGTGILFNDGTAAAPALAFFVAPNAGMFRPATDELGFATVGVERINIDANGIVTMPLQPSFLAFNSVTDTNVTGNGAAAIIDFDTEVFDLNADFAADTFTAPVTGKYLLSTLVRFDGITAVADQWIIRIITSNRSYTSTYGNTDDLGSTEILQLTVIADMDALDTATVQVVGSGEASDVWDAFGTAAPETFFSGSLLN